jgi:hypothetical protein
MSQVHVRCATPLRRRAGGDPTLKAIQVANASCMHDGKGTGKLPSAACSKKFYIFLGLLKKANMTDFLEPSS